MPAWRVVDDGVELAVRAKPRSRRAGIDGIDAEADGSSWLVVCVTVPAEDGKANLAVIAEIAQAAGVPRSAVVLLSGQTGRRKRLKIVADPPAILSALEKHAS